MARGDTIGWRIDFTGWRRININAGTWDHIRSCHDNLASGTSRLIEAITVCLEEPWLVFESPPAKRPEDDRWDYVACDLVHPGMLRETLVQRRDPKPGYVTTSYPSVGIKRRHLHSNPKVEVDKHDVFWGGSYPCEPPKSAAGFGSQASRFAKEYRENEDRPEV